MMTTETQQATAPSAALKARWRVQVLQTARELIEWDNFWVQDHHILDVDLNPVSEDWPTAVCFDITGAVKRSLWLYGLRDQKEQDEIFFWMVENAPEIGEFNDRAGYSPQDPAFALMDYNDYEHRTHAKVLISLDRLVRKAEAEEERKT